MKRFLMVVMLVMLMVFSTSVDSASKDWEFTWTDLDTSVVTDLVGYKLYRVLHGSEVVTGPGLQFWAGGVAEPKPVVLNMPEGDWDTYLTSIDLTGQESPPTLICRAIIDEPPPTPPDFACQAASP